MIIFGFLALCFGISLIAFVGIAFVPGAQSPENATGLPFWLVAVWGPSLAAFIMAWWSGSLGALLTKAIDFGSVSAIGWVLTFSPIAILAFVATTSEGFGKPSELTGSLILQLTLFNLILGPLGEEFGWRGFLQPALATPYGWLMASIIIGVVWAVWHFPLWLVPSPQSEIPLWIFCAHVMAYAIILGATHQLTGGSLVPAILFHLLVNLVAGIALVGGMGDVVWFYRATILPYWVMAGVSIGIVWLQKIDSVPLR